MKLEILAPVLVIAGAAIGLGVFFAEYHKADEGKFDERQLIERGRGASLAMNIGYSYLLGMFVGCSVDLIQSAYLPIVAIYGLVLMMIVYHGYCIFHDAYLNREQEWGKEISRNLRMGLFWAAILLAGGRRGGDGIWIDGAFALNYLAVAAMLLVRVWSEKKGVVE